MDSKTALIRSIRQTLAMSGDTAEQIVLRFQPIRFEKNDYVLKERRTCDANYFIHRGIMRSYSIDLEGNEVTTAFYSENSFVSDLLSFFNRTPSKENIQAVTPCDAWYMSYDDMQECFHAMPEFREFGRLKLVNSYSALKERMLSMLQETAEQRYNALIDSHPEIFQHVPLKHIASYLGITDTSLSRIRKELVRK